MQVSEMVTKLVQEAPPQQTGIIVLPGRIESPMEPSSETEPDFLSIQIAILLLSIQDILQAVNPNKRVDEKLLRQQWLILHICLNFLHLKIDDLPDYPTEYWRVTNTVLGKQYGKMRSEDFPNDDIYEETRTYIQTLTNNGELHSLPPVAVMKLYVAISLTALLMQERSVQAAEKAASRAQII